MSDPLKYRSKESAAAAKERDPIALYEVKLREAGLLSEEQATAMDAEIRDEIKESFAQADADPHPAVESRFEDALAETYPLEK